jgi:hypothetical protein
MFRKQFLSLGPFNDSRFVLAVNLTRYTVTAFILAAIVTVVPRFAHADLITLWSVVDLDNDTHHEVAYDDEDGSTWYIEIDLNTGENTMIEITGNPTPDGQDTGLGPDKDAINAMLEQLLKKGGSPIQTIGFWETELGKAMTEDGKGPSVTDPWEGGSMSFDPIEGYGGGGGGAGFDPMGGGIKGWIQKKKQGSSNGDDDGNDGGGKKEDFDIWGGFPADPALVNPVPIEKGFTLMGSFAPSGAGRTGPSNSNVFGLGNANMLGGAMNRGQTGPRAVNFGGATRATRAMAAPSSVQLR